ncbi:hypothetical protein B0H21DRAFT_694731 [Amylocystis lapponica]|nr:hypothetical protein B0H21DRAFT_694731 [Amylocystis lapponica]
MTRYTNVARKRTYVEAGFSYRHDPQDTQPQLQQDNDTPGDRTSPSIVEDEQPDRKKRRKTRSAHQPTIEATPSSSPEDREIVRAGQSGLEEEEGEGASGGSVRSRDGARKTSAKSRRLKGQCTYRPVRCALAQCSNSDIPEHADAEARKAASERRRIQRIQERHADTVCYACREKGHAARDCPKAVESSDKKRGNSTVGICYRCGSGKHNLSKCRIQADPANPLPFASCYVCSGKGHLASSCPENQSKGVYPNGGCCKLCGETAHLAKDCTLRKNDTAAGAIFLGTGHDAGADEDDFHTFKRRNAEVDKAEKMEERLKRQANVKVGAHTGVIKSFGKPRPAVKKKVVNF